MVDCNRWRAFAGSPSAWCSCNTTAAIRKLRTSFEPDASLRKLLSSFRQFRRRTLFVLSGYLIYSILLRRRPSFLAFMARRAQRLYPASLVTLGIGAAIDFLRPVPKIHAGVDALSYLAANFAFLPGRFPIEPLFAVNWSLSYEWWFYTSATVLCSVFGLVMFQSRYALC